MKNNLLPKIAVTGLGRGENPQPGFAVISSLRRRWPKLQIAGLVYDAMESGIYAEGHPDAAFTIPYPSCGGGVILGRIDEIREDFPFTALIPTLDAELEPLLSVEQALKERGIRIMLPDIAHLNMRNKKNLMHLAERAGVHSPSTFAVNTPEEAAQRAHKMNDAVMVKGLFYEAYCAHTPEQAAGFASRIFREWGGPVLIQERIEGEEFDVLAVGDGDGHMLGSCTVRKLVVSSRGKGYAGMTVEDDALTRDSEALVGKLQWRGPLELEFIRDREGRFNLIEINPRFPAWADFPAALGCNLSALALQRLLDWAPDAVVRVPAGKIFLRHSVDIVCDASDFGTLAIEGHVIRNQEVWA